MSEKNHCDENAKAERVNDILKQEYGLGSTLKKTALKTKRKGLQGSPDFLPDRIEKRSAFLFSNIVHEPFTAPFQLALE